MTNKKYKLTNETLEFEGRTLHRIEALRDFGSIKKGEKGGWVESEANLSHDGRCWIHHETKVMDEAVVREDSHIRDNVVVCDFAVVEGMAWIEGDVTLEDSATVQGRATIHDDVSLHNHVVVKDNAEVEGSVWLHDECVVKDSAVVRDHVSLSGQITVAGDALLEGDRDFTMLELRGKFTITN